MWRGILVICALATLGAAPAMHGYKRSGHDDAAYEAVPLVAVLSNREAFAGKRVCTGGYLTLEFENAGLAIDKVSYDAGLASNAVWVEPGKLSKQVMADLTRRYATVCGTVNAELRGHMGAYAASLVEVSRITPTFTNVDYQHWRNDQHDAVLAQALVPVSLVALLIAIAAGLWARRRRR